MVEVQAGPYLQRYIRSQISDTLKAVKKLAESLKSTNTNRKIISPLTGVVWECSERLERIPLDEKKAILDLIRNISLSVKDAISELDELKERSTSGSQKKDKMDTKDDDDDDDDADIFDFDDEDDVLSPDEVVVMPGVLQLLRLSLLFITKVEGFVSSSAPDADDTRGVRYTAWMDEMQAHVGELAGAVDELGSSTHTPQVRADVERHFGRLKEVILAALPSVQKNSVGQKDTVKTLLKLIFEKISKSELIIQG